ncbi:hypothetical protein [Flagellimonas eckloniae]|uniref:HTH cro/C1-type domain-containing protein n=1 Tax=Flagellimonas eckloniae TaxID=346185 RepID=A0A0Q1DMI6_9FLAO|nr:hypothetical protein [Allomuricauda eckloniae]KQC30206.1 hypothetical protein AAY42_10200 [Allomuricauda eckloniae]
MKAELTESEKEILMGKVRAIARKHKVSHTYINNIISNDVDIDSNKASKIFEDLKRTIEFFQPIP